MTDRNPSNELLELLKNQSRSAKDWSYSIAGAFWQNKGQIIDEEYLFTCLANAMMSMHDSIFNKEIKQLEKELQETKAQLEKAEKVIEFYYNIRNWESDQIDPIDHEEICDRWGDLEWLGGKRARQYFKDKQGSEK